MKHLHFNILPLYCMGEQRTDILKNENINQNCFGNSLHSLVSFVSRASKKLINKVSFIDDDSGILGKNPSAPLQESNLRPSEY